MAKRNINGGMSFDLKKDNPIAVKDYLKAMDKKNDNIFESQKRKTSNEMVGIGQYFFNKIFRIQSIGSSNLFRKNYEQIEWC